MNATVPEPGAARRRIRRITAMQELGPGLALVAIVLAIGIPHDVFFSHDVIVSNTLSAAFVAIIAFGLVYMLAMNEFDLSVGGTYGVCFWLAAKWMESGTLSPYVAALLAILVGVGLGAFNGILAILFRAPVIIVTLGTFSLYRGLVNVISEGAGTGQLPIESSFFTEFGGNWLGIPVAGWFAVGICAVLTFVFAKTRFGLMVRAIGANRQAAEFSGIPVGRVRLYALMLTGGLAGLSGVLSLAYYELGDPTVGSGLELQVIAAAIIGGTAISGGTGSVPGGILGALIVAVISSGLVFYGVSTLWGNVVTGAVILFAVGFDALLRQRRMVAARG